MLLKEGKKNIRENYDKMILSWLEKKYDDISHLLHDDIILSIPQYNILLTGKETVHDYVDQILNSGKILKYFADDWMISVDDNHASSSYRFTIEYDNKGKTFSKTGYELLVWEKNESHWQLRIKTDFFFQ